MDDTRARLVRCFATVFPDVPESEIPNASQRTVASWDSVGAITLVNVIEDEFQMQLDLEDIADLDSFERVYAYLESRVQPAAASL